MRLQFPSKVIILGGHDLYVPYLKPYYPSKNHCPITFGKDSRGGWRIQAAPKERGSFELRRKLPSAWCGLRDAELSGVAGIDGCVFVHANGFIGGHGSCEGAMAMARQALEL